MSKLGKAFGITVLFASALSAFAASSASASGATAFTCVQNAGGALFGPHCLKASTGDNTKYTHVAVTSRTTNDVDNTAVALGTSAVQSGSLKSILFGINTEVTCASVHGEGPLENKEAGGEMFGHAEVTLNYTGCVVKAPAEKGCKVKGEAITTELLTGRTVGEGATFKIEPINAEKKFTAITIEGCSIAALNNTFPVTGSLVLKTNGATLTSTHAEITTQNTLKFAGQKAGLDGAVTDKTHLNFTETTKPLSVTPTP